MSIMTLSIIRYLLLKGRPPRFCYGIWFVRFIILRLLPQVIIFKTLLTPCVIKPLRTQIIVFRYERWVVTSLYLRAKKNRTGFYYFQSFIFSLFDLAKLAKYVKFFVVSCAN